MENNLSLPPRMPMLPKESEIQTFKDNGYLIIKDALTADKVNKLLEAIKQSLEGQDISKNHNKMYDYTFKENKDKPIITGLRPIIDENREFLSLIELPSTFPTVVRLLQHYNIQLLTSHYVKHLPRTLNRSVGWHIDGGTSQPITDSGMRVMCSLKVCYALTDIEQENMGNVEVIPGSHKTNLKIPKERRIEHFQDAIQIKMKAGDAFLFDQRLWHCTAVNDSDQPRVALYYGYGYSQLKPIDYLTMPDHILQDCSAIGQQLLGKRHSSFTPYSFYEPTSEDVPLKKWYLDNFGETWLEY